jgi:uncharacterized membrane protein YbaN (DUF454 family)
MHRLREVAGFLLLITGAIGCVLPILPGIPLVLAGVYILAPRYPKIRAWRERIEQYWASVRKTDDRKPQTDHPKRLGNLQAPS